MKNKNLRTMVITTESGTDVKDTQQLKGEAKPTAAFKSKNEMKQYTVGAPPKTGLGGKPGFN